jgi:hypothetical protein
MWRRVVSSVGTNVQSPTEMKMKAVFSSETLVNTHESAKCLDPEEHNMDLKRNIQ